MTTLKATRGAVAVLAVTAVLGSFTGAAAQSPSPAGTPHPMPIPDSCKGDKPVLGVLLPNTVNPYYVAMRQSFLDNGAAAGYDVQVQIAEDSSEKQLAQAQALIQQGICAAALNGVDSAPAAAVVKAFNDAGIPVFTTNVIVSQPDMDAQGAYIQDYVGADQVSGGQLLAQEALKDFGADGAIVYGIVGDPEQIPTELRDSGWDQVMATNPNAKSAGKVNSKVDPTVSLRVTSDLLQGHPDINALWADTGPGTVGALAAIQQLGLQDKVKLYGFCAADLEMTGPYIACAGQQPVDYAKILVGEVGKYLKGEAIEQNILLPVSVNRGGMPAENNFG